MESVNRIVRYIVSGDSRPAVAAFEETALASEKAGRAVQASGEKNALSLKATAVAAEKTHGVISRFAGATGLIGLAFGLRDITQAGLTEQKQQAGLQQSLRATRQATKAHREEIEKAAKASATHGGFGVAEQLGGITTFIRQGHTSAAQAIKLNTEATALARGATEDYGTAVSQVARLQTGQVGRLGKLIGVIQPVTKHVGALAAAHRLDVYWLQEQAKALGKAGPEWLKQQMLYAGINPQALRHAQLLDKQATATAANTALMKKFGGATDAYGKTAAGALSNADNSLHMLEESLGKKLLPALGDTAKWVQKNETLVLGFGVGLLALVTTIKAVELATRGAAAGQRLWNIATGASRKPGTGALGGVSGAAGQRVYVTNWEMIRSGHGGLPGPVKAAEDAAKGGGALAAARALAARALPVAGAAGTALALQYAAGRALPASRRALNPSADGHSGTGLGPLETVLDRLGIHIGGPMATPAQQRQAALIAGMNPRVAAAVAANQPHRSVNDIFAGLTIAPGKVDVHIEGRKVGEAVVHYTLQQNARHGG